MQQEDLDTAAVQLQNVYVDTLSDSAKGIYNTISERTGVTGITDSSSDSTAAQSDSSGADSSSDGTDQTASEDSGDGYTEE